MIAGSSFNAGCVTTTGAAKINDQSVMNQIKEGATTKDEVRRLLGEPSSVSRTSSGEESWTYYSDNMQSNQDAQTAMHVGSMFTQAFVPIPGLGWAATAATPAIMRSGKHTSYFGEIHFNSQGIVTSASSSVTGGSNMSRSAMINNPSVTVTPKQQSPVYVAKDSRVYHHDRNCSELSTADLVEFASSQEARKAGGAPCKHCNPS